MKTYIKFLIIISIVGVCICGCNIQEETTPLMIYEQLKITDRPLSEADSGVIQEGITNWVKSFLAINSDTRDKEAIDKGLYQSIANKEQKEKLKQERELLYKPKLFTEQYLKR